MAVTGMQINVLGCALRVCNILSAHFQYVFTYRRRQTFYSFTIKGFLRTSNNDELKWKPAFLLFVVVINLITYAKQGFYWQKSYLFHVLSCFIVYVF